MTHEQFEALLRLIEVVVATEIHRHKNGSVGRGDVDMVIDVARTMLVDES